MNDLGKAELFMHGICMDYYISQYEVLYHSIQ